MVEVDCGPVSTHMAKNKKIFCLPLQFGHCGHLEESDSQMSSNLNWEKSLTLQYVSIWIYPCIKELLEKVIMTLERITLVSAGGGGEAGTFC